MTELKHCPGCGQDKPQNEFSRDRRRADGLQGHCKDCRKTHASTPEGAAARRQWRQANPDKLKEYRRRGQRQHNEARNRRLRAAVFDHYGWACACCGTTERLCIDHIDGDGRAHRDELFGRGGGRTSGYEFYRWVIKSGFPERLQTLCRPCNTSKGTSASCRIDHSAGGSAEHDHEDVADRITGILRAVHSTDFAVIGATWTEANATEFAVTMDTGQRFAVTVRPY